MNISYTTILSSLHELLPAAREFSLQHVTLTTILSGTAGILLLGALGSVIRALLQGVFFLGLVGVILLNFTRLTQGSAVPSWSGITVGTIIGVLLGVFHTVLTKRVAITSENGMAPSATR